MSSREVSLENKAPNLHWRPNFLQNGKIRKFPWRRKERANKNYSKWTASWNINNPIFPYDFSLVYISLQFSCLTISHQDLNGTSANIGVSAWCVAFNAVGCWCCYLLYCYWPRNQNVSITTTIILFASTCHLLSQATVFTHDISHWLAAV